jgi:hypothetical protein
MGRMLRIPGIHVPHVLTVRCDPSTATVAAVIVLVKCRPNSPSYGTNLVTYGNRCLLLYSAPTYVQINLAVLTVAASILPRLELG